MNLNLHLVTDKLVLSMWPLGHHHHHGDHLVAQADGLAGVGENVTGATTPVHSDMAGDDLEHIATVDHIPETDGGGNEGTYFK